jgi:hypothetical protein
VPDEQKIGDMLMEIYSLEAEVEEGEGGQAEE